MCGPAPSRVSRRPGDVHVHTLGDIPANDLVLFGKKQRNSREKTIHLEAARFRREITAKRKGGGAAPKHKAAKLQGSNKSVARAATAVGAGLQELLLGKRQSSGVGRDVNLYVEGAHERTR